MKVQQLSRSRSCDGGGNVRSSALLTGMLKCGDCGSAMFTQTATGNGGRYHYYVCSKELRGQGCESKNLRVDLVDAVLREALMGILLTRERLQEILVGMHASAGTWVKEREDRRTGMVAQLRGLEERRRNLYDILELQGQAAPNLGDLTVRLRDLSANINRLQTELDEIEALPAPGLKLEDTTVDDMGEMVRGLVSTASPAKVRAFLAGFILEARKVGDSLKITYNPDRILMPAGMTLVHSDGNWLPDLARLRTETLTVRLPSPSLTRRAA